MGVYLEDHPPARSQFRRTRRAEVTGAIVVHTAESTPDLTLPDDGAESVANFISRRTDGPGSYHSIVDSDSTVHVGEYSWEMFGEGKGGNRWALHLSFATEAHLWAEMKNGWTVGAIDQAAAECVRMAEWVRETVGVEIPAKRITRPEYFDGKPGFISHAEIDPGRRSDPGRDFPWVALLDRFQGLQVLALPVIGEDLVKEMQQVLKDNAGFPGELDGIVTRPLVDSLHALKIGHKAEREARERLEAERDTDWPDRPEAITDRLLWHRAEAARIEAILAGQNQPTGDYLAADAKRALLAWMEAE